MAFLICLNIIDIRFHIKKHVSHNLESMLAFSMAVRTGLEPATSCVTGRHSNQLNYRTQYWV